MPVENQRTNAIEEGKKLNSELSKHDKTSETNFKKLSVISN